MVPVVNWRAVLKVIRILKSVFMMSDVKSSVESCRLFQECFHSFSDIKTIHFHDNQILKVCNSELLRICH